MAIEPLRGIQWQPGDGQPLADGWLALLKRIRAGGKGFIYHSINETLTVEEGQAFLDELRASHV